MEEEIIMVPQEGLNATEKFTWGRGMVLILIEEYKRIEHEFKDSNIKKKHVWRKISQRLAERGYPDITENMCDKKWRNLKKTFKEIYVGQRGSQLRTRWEFYNTMEEIFSKDPNIVSAASVSVSTKSCLTTKKIPGPDGQDMRVEVMEVVGNRNDDNLDDRDSASTEEIVLEVPDRPVCEVPDKSSQPPAWFQDFLEQYQSDEKRRVNTLNKMHADIVALEEKKCALLATLIEKLGGPTEVPDSYSCAAALFQRLEAELTEAQFVQNYN